MNVPPVGSDAAPSGRDRPGRSAGERAGAAGNRLRRAWRALHGEQRLAAIAALALLGTMFLPWYKTTAAVVVKGSRASIETGTESGLQAFTFVEGAVLLLAGGVLLLLFARAERRAFHLPGGDGTVITAAGAWAAFLIVWRFFDRPDLGRGVTVGLQWGIFVALLVALLLAYAGTRIRHAGRPEPPLVDHDRGDDRVFVPDERPWLDETEQLPPARERRTTRIDADDRPRQHPAEVPEPADPPAPPDSLR
jgi:hypothetical protein